MSESESEKTLSCVQPFATPWTIQSMEFSRPEYQSGQPFPSPGDLPNPRIKPRSPSLQADSLSAERQRKSVICLCECESRSVVSNSATPQTVARQAPLSMGSPGTGKSTGMGCPFLLHDVYFISIFKKQNSGDIRDGKLLLHGFRVSVWGKEKVLEIAVMITQHCECN